MRCKSGQHEWEKEEDAAKCCNGWIRLEAPWLYGEKETPFGPIRQVPLQPFNAYKKVWVRETDTEEIAALRAMFKYRLSIAH